MSKVFVTGASGFIGSALVLQAVSAGHSVLGLTRSEASAQRLVALGAKPIIGDLAVTGPWQEAAAESEYVIHLAQPDTYGARVTLKRARTYSQTRLQMDSLLLSSLDEKFVRRVVFVCGTSYYGDQGESMRDEDTRPNPRGWGPYIAPAIDALAGFVSRGLPIVEAYPGWVYGPGSWFAEYQLEPLSRGRRVMRLAGKPQIVSAVQVEDCARALLHLLEHAETGQRYFVVDDTAIHSTDMVGVAAKELGVAPRTLPMPKFFCRLAMGTVITDSMTCNFRLSNQRLKSLGFSFNYPSIESGIPKTVKDWLLLKEQEATSATA